QRPVRDPLGALPVAHEDHVLDPAVAPAEAAPRETDAQRVMNALGHVAASLGLRVAQGAQEVAVGCGEVDDFLDLVTVEDEPDASPGECPSQRCEEPGSLQTDLLERAGHALAGV